MDSFKEVAMVEYPRRGIYALGFISNRFTVDIDGAPRRYVAVFVPSTPTPISGMVILVPAEEVVAVGLTIEEGVKFLVSGGVAAPEMIRRKNNPALDNNGEVGSETR
jgi:uncharacterized membrane protein